MMRVGLPFSNFLHTKSYENNFHPQNKSCAVIFSSPVLLNREYGKIIDSYDFVIRFNMAPTLGYEKFVGSKTTHRILGGYRGTPYYFMEQNELVLRPNKPVCWHKYFNNDYENYLNFSNKAYFDNYFITDPCGCSSNGPVGLLFAIKYFSEVGLFGFNLEIDRNKWHYFDDLKNTKYCKEIMSVYDLPNPYDKIVSSATAEQHTTYAQEKESILKLVRDKKVVLNGA